MAFLHNDNNKKAAARRRQSEELTRLRSLRDDVSSSHHVDDTKDDIIANPDSARHGRYRRRRSRHRSYIQIDDDDDDTDDITNDVVDDEYDAASAMESGLRRNNRRKDLGYSSSTERVRNHQSSGDDNGYNGHSGNGVQQHHYSSSTERVRNRNNGNRRRVSPAARSRRSENTMTSSERSEAVALMISQRPLDDDDDFDDGDGNAAYEECDDVDGRSHRSLRTERSLPTTSTPTDTARGGRRSSGRRLRNGGAASSSRVRLSVSRSRLPPPARRRDLWLGLAATQLVSIGSLRRAQDDDRHTWTEAWTLFLMSSSFLLSFGVGAGHFHGPFRRLLAKFRSIGRGGFVITTEQLLACLLTLLAFVQSGLVLSTSTSPGGVGAMAVVAGGGEVWNANLFYAAWAGLYGAVYLTAHAFTDAGTGGFRPARQWFMAGFSSICASVAAFTTTATTTTTTSGSSSSTAAGALGAFGAVLSLLGGVASRPNQQRDGAPFGRALEASASTVLLAASSVSVGLLAAPGSDSVGGSVLLTSWLTFAIGLCLWKGRLESFLFPRETSAAAAFKPLRKRNMQGGGDRRSDADTYATDDSESDPSQASLLNSMEEGNNNNSHGDGGESASTARSLSTASHSEILHCLKSLSRNAARDDDDDVERRRHPLDPDMLSQSTADCDSTNPDGRRPSHDPPEASDCSSGYYSGSQAVRVQVGTQEEVSAMSLTLAVDPAGGALSESETSRIHREDPGGLRGSSLSRRRRRRRRDGSRRNYVQEPSPGGIDDDEGLTTMPPPRDPSFHDREDAGGGGNNGEPQRDPSTPGSRREKRPHKKNRAQRGPAATPPTRIRRRLSRDSLMSNFSPIEETSREGSEDTSPKSEKKEKHRRSTRSKSTSSRRSPRSKSSNSSSRRSSRSSSTPSSRSKSRSRRSRRSKSSCPSSRSGSSRPSSASKSNGKTSRRSTRSSSSRPSTSRSGGGGRPPRKSSSFHPSTRSGGVSRPMPRRSSLNPPREADPNEKKPSTGSAYETVGPLAAPRAAAATKAFNDSISTSSSDFDIVVSANRSVMTDLTEEVFDAPPPHNAPALDATEAARLYAGYDPANRAQSYRQAPPSLPRRLPLYNGSDDASSPGKHTASPGNSDFTPSLRGEEVHPSVESFLASAMRNVRLNRSHSNLDDDGEDDDRPPTSDEEEKSPAEERRHRSDRRKSGGVNSTDSSGSERKGGGGSKRQEKRSHGSSGGGRRKGKGSSSSRPAAEQGFQSDPGSRRSPAERLGARVVSVPTKGGGGRSGAAPQRRRSRSDVPSKSRRRHATPPRKSAPAKGGASPGTRRRSMRSYASADDDDDSFGESTDDSDPLESLRFEESDF